MCAPYIGLVSIRDIFRQARSSRSCDGENYGGARPCHYEWVKTLRDECAEANVTFVFCGTGRRFVKDGKLYKLEGRIQSEQAYKSGLSFEGRRVEWHFTDEYGYNGCSSCGKCGSKAL